MDIGAVGLGVEYVDGVVGVPADEARDVQQPQRLQVDRHIVDVGAGFSGLDQKGTDRHRSEYTLKPGVRPPPADVRPRIEPLPAGRYIWALLSDTRAA